MQSSWRVVVAVMAGLAATSAHAHELWFQPPGGPKAATVRLTFADTPDPTEAEAVAEIARAKVWADGAPLDVTRQADGLEAALPSKRPAVLSAYADRGVVAYNGEAFVIALAAYAQSKALPIGEEPKLGLGDDQLRLLLVADASGTRTIRATHKGKPAAGVDVRVFLGDESRDARTDANGTIPCPEFGRAGVSLLAQLRDDTPGQRDGQSYAHTRYKATLNLTPDPDDAAIAERLDRVRAIHGGVGPWAVAGERVGERALKELGAKPQDFALLVVHHSPAEVQYSCMADGLQAATGVSAGKLNLRVEPATVETLHTTITDRKTGRTLTFTLRPEFARSILDVPYERHEAEGRRVATLEDDVIFTMTLGVDAPLAPGSR